MTAFGYALLFVVSAAILAYEIFLMGLFALIQWHHFASMIISIALLGFGVSGTLLALWRSWFVAQWRMAFRGAALLFFFSVAGVTWLLPQVPFNPFRLAWDAQPLLPLSTYYLLLLVPFTAGATVIGLAFTHPRSHISSVTCANLLGSGLGVVAGLLCGFLPMNVPLSEYKSLSKCLLLPEAKVVWTAASPLGRVDVVSAPALRVAPGLSLAYHGPIPPQEAVFVNGDGPSALPLANPHAPSMEFVDWLPTALPYRLLDRPKVLVIGVGGGLDLLQAMRLSGSAVTGIESHPHVARYVRRQIDVPVDLRIADARGFVRGTTQTYDLIEIGLLESFATANAGVCSLAENHLYTVEAFTDFRARLSEKGMLAITLWLKTPPRDELRLFATAVRALELAGVVDPWRHLLFARGLQTGTLILGNAAFTPGEIRTAQQFCRERWFDLDYFPGIGGADANRYNRVADNRYFRVFHQVLFGDRDALFRSYPFDLRPTTDDCPFFSQFFQWQHARQLWTLFRSQALPLVEWGYLMLLATLVQTCAASAILIGLPLALAKARSARESRVEENPSPRISRLLVLIYFAALGTGFMLLEMAMLQKLVLFLAHPIYSASVVIGSFLLFAGLGSSVARLRSAFVPLCAIVAAGTLELLALPSLLGYALAATTPVRILVTVAAIAPLAFLLGMPFPIGLRRLSQEEADLVPWAWAVNGCFSVVAASLAPLLAITFGFTTVIAIGLCSYLTAVLASGCWSRGGTAQPPESLSTRRQSKSEQLMK